MHMAQTKAWTLEEFHALPDDGNKYELVRGELFVTPAPSVDHEELVSALQRIIEPYVLRHGLGKVYRPRAVIRASGSEVEPDLMVRPLNTRRPDRWEDMPLPILVVEILSDSTRQRDHGQKRAWYLDAGIAEYWVVDGEMRTIRVIAPRREDVVTAGELTWMSAQASEPLQIDVATYFREALGSGAPGDGAG